MASTFRFSSVFTTNSNSRTNFCAMDAPVALGLAALPCALAPCVAVFCLQFGNVPAEYISLPSVSSLSGSTGTQQTLSAARNLAGRLRVLNGACILLAVLGATVQAASLLLSLVTLPSSAADIALAVLPIVGWTLTAATAFTALNLLGRVNVLIEWLPYELLDLFKARVAMNRIISFLTEPNLEKFSGPVVSPPRDSPESFDDASDLATIGDSAPVIGFTRARFMHYVDGVSSKSDAASVKSASVANETTPLINAASSSTLADDAEASATFVLRDLHVEFPVGGLSTAWLIHATIREFVVLVKNGEVACQGTPQELSQNPNADSIFGIDLSIDSASDEEESSNALIDSNVAVATAEGKGTTLVDDEEKATGSVQLSVYKTYFEAAGGFVFACFFMLSFLLVSSAGLANDWWLKSWTDHNAAVGSAPLPSNSSVVGMSLTMFGAMHDRQVFGSGDGRGVMSALAASSDVPTAGTDGGSIERSEAIFYIAMYAVFGLIVMIANNIRTCIVLFGTLIATRRLHDTLLTVILRSPLRFFEVTPIGRILNRFSKDVESVDSQVMEGIERFIAKVVQTLTIIAVIGSINPPFLIALLPVIVVYRYISSRYVNFSREAKRLEAISRSPIYAQFSETLTGVATIRAYGAQDRFAKLNMRKIDANHQSFMLIWATNRWLNVRTDLLSAAIVLCAGISVIVGGASSGWAALTLTYALNFTDAVMWTVRFHAEMELSMNSP
eukprot:jgi/Hompol1/6401/HPOL_000857-RA